MSYVEAPQPAEYDAMVRAALCGTGGPITGCDDMLTDTLAKGLEAARDRLPE
jgi:hypothetical protein